MAVAVIHEFPIQSENRTTTTYDRVQQALGMRDNLPAGGIVHTAGFDEAAGVFRIFDVWESREAWDAYLNNPAIRSLMEHGGRQPETRVYELHNLLGLVREAD